MFAREINVNVWKIIFKYFLQHSNNNNRIQISCLSLFEKKHFCSFNLMCFILKYWYILYLFFMPVFKNWNFYNQRLNWEFWTVLIISCLIQMFHYSVWDFIKKSISLYINFIFISSRLCLGRLWPSLPKFNF